MNMLVLKKQRESDKMLDFEENRKRLGQVKTKLAELGESL